MVLGCRSDSHSLAVHPQHSERIGSLETPFHQILMDAELAMEMGCPIYGVLALTSTATDKNGRSIPAPGQGILTTAREASATFKSPMLDLSYRKQNLAMEFSMIKTCALP